MAWSEPLCTRPSDLHNYHAQPQQDLTSPETIFLLPGLAWTHHATTRLSITVYCRAQGQTMASTLLSAGPAEPGTVPEIMGLHDVTSHARGREKNRRRRRALHLSQKETLTSKTSNHPSVQPASRQSPSCLCQRSTCSHHNRIRLVRCLLFPPPASGHVM